jgi:hypothetical protein
VDNLNGNLFLDWARVLATEYGGRVTTVSDGDVRLTPDSEQWKKVLGTTAGILLNANPTDPDAWRVRLQHVEKRIAQALISAPVAFSCSVKAGRGSGDRSVELFRLAFGLSLSLGVACACRYTAYYFGGAEKAFYVAGRDKLFECCGEFGAVNVKNKEVTDGLRRLLEVIPEVVCDYQDSEPIRRQIDLQKTSLSRELRDLDRLYVARHGQYSRLLGQPPEPAKGDDAIELEYFRRIEDVVAKYGVSVRFVPLTLGVIKCNIQVKTRKNRSEITLPFVDSPLRGVV